VQRPTTRSQRGEDFIAEVERVVERLSDFPEHGKPYLAGTRRMLLARFPYSVVYLSDADSIQIVAIAHHRRKPGYWRTRM